MALILGQILLAQSAGRAKKPTGPRALGLIEVTPSGKMTLLPVVVMIDGEFYDASAYKASPVPFALYTDTVYEGVKTGVSQGLFTVTEAQHGETTWRGIGKWQSAEEIAAAEAKKKASAVKAAKAKTIRDSSDGPPVLHRRGDESQAPAASTPSTTSGSDPDDPNGPPVLRRPKTDQSQSAPTGPTATPAASTAAPSTSAPQTPSPKATTAPAAQPQASAPPANDPDAPTLRRGKAAAVKEEAREAASAPSESAIVKTSGASISEKPAASAISASATSASSTASGIQYFPAISDADGPEPRPYAYNMKAEEEAKFRDKMLALAAIEIRGRAKELGLGTVGTAAPGSQPGHASSNVPAMHPHKATKPADPSFTDVQLRVFDLSNNNEPILVLTANAQLPQPKGVGAVGLQYVVTLVAREDIYGDLHKAFSNVTDTQHLDVLPRLELIDAVDADGDGRGELLFRQVSDSGKAFVLYRVIGDQLWPLFQGKIG